MFQPRVKLEFVRRYCSPSNGWKVFIDIDASEEGRTGGKRTSDGARDRQQQMILDGTSVREQFADIGVQVGGNHADWFTKNELPEIKGDRDIIAFHLEKKLYLIAEVEGTSSSQPEQKLYKAIGQIVIAAGTDRLLGWKRKLILVVHGSEIAEHLGNAGALTKLGISAIAIAPDQLDDRWMFGESLPI